ncbi:exported hypothetical protein [uncultured Alphaproteobacteria bacterium]|uniref:Uncharacterized protein n=1 Tax=uncultured Alphaproteobacteria bacterium TaxID=91750 RepID=A0A212KN15_9PROT|nr:exported hypothetical protein [uncultured Alphaproteobacteria bacterium]
MLAYAFFAFVVSLFISGYAVLCLSDPEGRSVAAGARYGISGAVLFVVSVGYLIARALWSVAAHFGWVG